MPKARHVILKNKILRKEKPNMLQTLVPGLEALYYPQEPAACTRFVTITRL